MEKYVILTRPEGQNIFLQKELEKVKIPTYEFPSIRIVDSVLSHQQENEILSLETFDWIIFTSVNGVNAFIHKMNSLGKSLEDLRGIKVGAIGPSTKKAIENVGLVVSFMPSSYVSSKIPKDIGNVNGLKILLPRADIAGEELSYELEGLGATVVNIPIYKTEYINDEDTKVYEHIKKDDVIVTFSSASIVTGFVNRVKNEEAIEAVKIKTCICIGPVTADKARSCGFQNIYIADTYTLKGLLDKLLKIVHE